MFRECFFLQVQKSKGLYKYIMYVHTAVPVLLQEDFCHACCCLTTDFNLQAMFLIAMTWEFPL